jgi:tetratricopeptide (TPR) repeat protein
MWTIIGVIAAVIVLALVVFVFFILRTDPSQTLGDPVARRVVDASYGGDYQALRDHFRRLPKERWDVRAYYTTIYGDALPISCVDSWCEEKPDEADAHLLRGSCYIRHAWQARGSGTADTVSQRSAELFFERLTIAHDSLRRAAAMNPRDPTPWARLLVVAMGLSASHEQARAYFQEAVKRDPEHWSAHINMHYLLTEKWGGSHEAMFSFAREVAQRAPLGSDLPILVLQSHVERWFYIYAFDGDSQAAQSYFLEAAHQQEALDAYMRSLGSSQHRNRRTTIFARHAAAFWFWKVRDRERLHRELSLIGDRIASDCWPYAGFGGIKKARRFAGV